MIYDQFRPDERMLVESAKNKGVTLNLYDAEQLALDATGLKDPTIFDALVLQRCVSHFRGFHITALLESKGIKVINSLQSASICGNKMMCSLALARGGVPTPKTYVAFTRQGALKALEAVGYPAVLKPVVGSWGRLIAPLKDIESASAILESREFLSPIHQIYYIQEMVKRPPRDIRCVVVADQAVAAMYRYAPDGDWRTNAARGARVEACKITAELEELSIKAASAIGEGIFGVDLMEDESTGMVVHEVNCTTEFKHLVEATGVDVAGTILDYAVEKTKR